MTADEIEDLAHRIEEARINVMGELLLGVPESSIDKLQLQAWVLSDELAWIKRRVTDRTAALEKKGAV